MITKLTYDNDKCIIDCDGVVIPSHGIRVTYDSNTARPFMYFEPKVNYNNKDIGVVLVGEYGSIHRDLVNKNMILIKGKYQIKDGNDVLQGRIWENIKDFGTIITFWDMEYGHPISSELIGKVKKALKSSYGIDIGKMTLVFDCDGDGDYYFIEANDYIFGDYSDPTDLDYAYTRQQNVGKGGCDASRYAKWDYNDQGVGYLGYHLMTRQDENKHTKMNFTESDIRYMIKECIKKILNK